ncbi:hypothetical protein [Schleiferilactobacillus perolens]|jgi:hypothetical protein|uniref:hypothetical protein n=1 Tax=Schleiferilactobacillus perolens TaxID=100468 RepID=UPI002356E4AD|nr:hypothetical protein [Schleiferilactobacillus perolens]MCI2172551.1 hypothetical protein [Schleiferilactobacillus perolens]
MKISKVLASLLLLGGIGITGTMIGSAETQVQAESFVYPAIVQIHSTHGVFHGADINQGNAPFESLKAWTSWQVTDVRIDLISRSIWLRVSSDGWIEYSLNDHASDTLIAEMKNTVSKTSLSQGNLNGLVTGIQTPDYNQVKTLTRTPVVDRPGSTKVVRQLPAGTRWRTPYDARKPLITKNDDTPVYYQIATNQWVESKYVQDAYTGVSLAYDKKLQVYRFNPATLTMVPTRQLPAHSAWRFSGIYAKTYQGQHYYLIGNNEWADNGTQIDW